MAWRTPEELAAQDDSRLGRRGLTRGQPDREPRDRCKSGDRQAAAKKEPDHVLSCRATAVARLSFIRYSTPHQPMPAHYPPCVCLITQGRKSTAFGAKAQLSAAGLDPARAKA